MKTFFGFLLIALTLTNTVFAQTESFDIATFVRPAGWARSESNGVVVLQNSKAAAGRVEICQIFLFPSVPANTNAAAIFQTEWNTKINQPLGLSVMPAPQAQTTPEGWTVLTGFADFMQAGVPRRTLLVVSTGFGRSISIVVAVTPNSCQTEIEKFFNDLKLDTNTPRPSPPGRSANSNSNATVSSKPGSDASTDGSLDNYIYVAPAQWTQQAAHDRIVLSSPVYNNGERCQITLLPMRPSSQPLATEAIGSFRNLFQSDPLTTYPSPPPKLASGMSPQGWEYFTIRKLVGGQEGESRTLGVTLLVARLNNQIATVAGISKDFLVSKCFGELAGDVWPAFFYSFGFRSAGANLPQETIRQQLAGDWITATASVGLRYTFLVNGRYKGAAASRYDSPSRTTTQAFFGDGSYSTNGNTLVLTGDDQRRSTMFFRVQKVSKDSGRTWGDELCLLSPGATGEVCYRKE